MKALLVIDAQNGIVNFGDFQEEIAKIERVIKDFKHQGSPVIFVKHLDDNEESQLYEKSVGADIHSS
ncbi:isochorismatase family protein [Heyndrickxia acidicola]|uniref:isochorismatase family protein n=1 Tax=Heyndrickxia acidicola TaxID=209389 RepID=UPI000AC20A75